LPFLRNQVINIDRRPNTSFGPRMVVCDVIRTAIGILAKHSRKSLMLSA
jgi:hypothetical protein